MTKRFWFFFAPAHFQRFDITKIATIYHVFFFFFSLFSCVTYGIIHIVAQARGMQI